MSETLRPCWQNCFLPDDKHALKDHELAEIDAMEDSLAPLDDNAVRIRKLITCFESCYHESDRQAELAGPRPNRATGRPGESGICRIAVISFRRGVRTSSIKSNQSGRNRRQKQKRWKKICLRFCP